MNPAMLRYNCGICFWESAFVRLKYARVKVNYRKCEFIHMYSSILETWLKKIFRAKSHMYLVQSGNSSPDTVKSFVCSVDVHTQTSESAGTGHSTQRWAVDLDPWAETRHRPWPITSTASFRQQPTAAAYPAHTQAHGKPRAALPCLKQTALDYCRVKARWRSQHEVQLRENIVSFQFLVGFNIFQHVGEFSVFFKLKLSLKVLRILKTCRICHISSSGVINWVIQAIIYASLTFCWLSLNIIL